MTLLIGSAAVGADGHDFEGANFGFACKLTAVATGTVDTITLRTNVANAAATIQCGVYSDSAGTRPNALIGVQKAITVTTGQTNWFTSAAGIGAAVTSGTVYWLAFIAASQFDFSLNATAAGLCADKNVGSTTLPASWVANAATFTETVNCHADTSGGAAIVVPRHVVQTIPVQRAANW